MTTASPQIVSTRRPEGAGPVRAVHRLFLLVVGCLAFAAIAFAALPASAQDRDPAYAEFYETLDRHGEWIVHPRYGETWVPYAREDREWRPYSRGQWVYTEENGWYWESDEEFGWIVYHYGRWLLDPRHGWMWVPGREWGPAWVAWREGDEAIGWAPLPPEAEFDGDMTGSYTFDTLDQPRYAPMWMFVAPAMLTLPLVYRHFYPPQRSTYYFGRSRFATFYSYQDRRVFNRGIDRRVIERHTNRPVPVLQVRPMTSPREFGAGRGGDRGSVGVYRPQISAPPMGRPSPRPGQPPPSNFGGRGPGSFGAPAAVPPNPAPRQAPGFGQGGGPGGVPGGVQGGVPGGARPDARPPQQMPPQGQPMPPRPQFQPPQPQVQAPPRPQFQPPQPQMQAPPRPQFQPPQPQMQQRPQGGPPPQQPQAGAPPRQPPPPRPKNAAPEGSPPPR